MKRIILTTLCLAIVAYSATICRAASCQILTSGERPVGVKETGALRGRVVDSQGDPIVSAQVRALVSPSRQPHGYYGPPSAATDESGRYRIEGVASGIPHQVEATAQGYGRHITDQLVLKKDELCHLRNLVLHVADKSIEGIITDTFGEPVDGAEISASGRRTGRRTAVADENGGYRLENLMDEEIRISARIHGGSARAPGYGQTTAKAGDQQANVVLRYLSAIELSIYRAKGYICGETSLTDSIWVGLEEEEQRKGPLQFFTLADLTIGDVTLRANQNEWTWDGNSEPPVDGEIELVTRRQFVVVRGVGGRESITDLRLVPIEYFERRADGLFELKKMPVYLGLWANVRAEQTKSGRILLRDLWMDWNTILGRRAIEGVDLNIGPPIVAEGIAMTDAMPEGVSYSRQTFGMPITEKRTIPPMSLLPGRYYGILVPTVGQGTLIARLRVDIRDPAKGT